MMADPVTPPTGLVALTEFGDLTARLTVVALRHPDGRHLNAFTFIRVRRSDSLGPWRPKANGQWRREDLGYGFELFAMDAGLDHCQELAEAAISRGTMTVDDIECHYALLAQPRTYWAYRNDDGGRGAPIVSPFFAHSAEVVEHWSPDTETRKLLTKALDGLPSRWGGFGQLGFPLRDRADRLGNLVVALASDAITCHLFARPERRLALEVIGDVLPGEYRANVWAAHAGDDLLRREVAVRPGTTMIELPSDPDRIGFALFRTIDGQCVDLMDAGLIMTVQVDIPGKHRSGHQPLGSCKRHGPHGQSICFTIQSRGGSRRSERGSRPRRSHEIPCPTCRPT